MLLLGRSKRPLSEEGAPTPPSELGGRLAGCASEQRGEGLHAAAPAARGDLGDRELRLGQQPFRQLQLARTHLLRRTAPESRPEAQFKGPARDARAPRQLLHAGILRQRLQGDPHRARHHIYNNIFANNAGPQGKTHQLSLQTWNSSTNGVFLRDRQPKMLKDYERLMANPAWAEMRGMHVSPAKPFLPDGTIMRGNVITKNIFYYPDQPSSRYISENGVSLRYNTINSNTVWNGGALPVKTGRQAVKKALADLTRAIPNADFARRLTPEELAKDANSTVAADWSWYHKTFPNLSAEIVAANGTNALRLPGAFNKEQRYVKNTCVRSAPFALAPGKSYRLTFRLRHQDATGELTARFVCENQGLWKAFGARDFLKRSDMSDVITATEGIECQTAFFLPKPGDADYDARVTSLTLQFQFNSGQGWAELSDLRLEEAEAATEWEAWQMAGADAQSVVADPLFVDAEHGNFALKPESPALKLGFEPIPLREIGPRADDARATWPIREAEGVREHPEWLESVPMK
jgi:hypothetical protein